MKPRINTTKNYESHLSRIRVNHGLTWKQLAKAVGSSIDTLVGLNNGTVSPLFLNSRNGSKKGDLKPITKILCEFFNLTLADLFPVYADGLEPDLTNEQKYECVHGAMMGAPVGYRKEFFALLKQALPRRQRMVIICRFWNDMTLEEIGKILGVHRERVRQIEEKALRKLRHPRNRKHFEGYLDTLN